MDTSIFFIFILLPCVWSAGRTKIRYNGTKDNNINVLYSGLRSSRSLVSPSDSTVCPSESGEIIEACMTDLLPLVTNGFPWGYQKMHKEEQSQSKVGDPLDPIYFACKVFDGCLACLEDHRLPDECIFAREGFDYFGVKVLFKLICHVEKPSTNLLRSLECLQKTRVVDLMEFHLTNTYGSTVLDKERQGRTNAYFTLLNSEALLKMSIPAITMIDSVGSGLVCLEECDLVKYVPEIVSRKCDNRAVGLVRNYFVQYRQKFTVATRKMGFSDICRNHVQVEGMPNRNLSVLAYTKTELETKEKFEQFLESRAVGSALDTRYGKYVLDGIKDLTVKTMCNATNMALQAIGCIMVSDDNEEISRFKVLYAAHTVSPYTNHGPRCQRLDIFHSCWDFLLELCGEGTVRLFNHTFTLISGSCGIKREMEDVPCEWQDVLYRYYIGASEGGNLCPLSFNSLTQPMLLDSTRYLMGNVLKSTSSLFSTLDKSVNEVGKICK